jgi:single-stranded-DNA-specific exonuclease
MERAVDRLLRAIRAGERICVWGDFDVDGQTATSLLVSALHSLGARVSYHIPIRSQESHGISLPALQKQIEAGLDLLLTCDTGITANEAVQFASENVIDTIITDHHALPSHLPQAYAIISPRLLDDPDHPLATLPGVGVAYKLIEALCDQFDRSHTCQDYLDLVALGIVADVATLVKDTRYLLQLGLRRLQYPSRPGLIALMETAGLQPGSINEETISFVFAPRMNAVGRLSDANPMVEFLTTSDLGAARLQAQEIESLNAQRKLLTDQVFKAALSLIERDPVLLETSALVLSYPAWPAGVIGIIASRLVEYFHKPVVLFASPPGEIARGSARSIPGIDITQAIASQADILAGFGGHPMAAGLSIQPEKIPEFRQGLARAVDRQIAEAGLSLKMFCCSMPTCPSAP